MLLTIVLLVFALHVMAWLILPAGYPRSGSRVRVDRADVHPYRRVATAMSMGDPLEG